MLADAPGSVQVSYNGVTAPGILARSSDYVPTGDGMSVQVKTRTLTIQNGVFTDLRVDGRILIGGVSYTIREFDDDGIADGIPLPILVARAP